MTAANSGKGAASAAPYFPTRWQVAVHEAAHAVYARERAIIVAYVSVAGIAAVENGGESGGSFGRCGYKGEAAAALESSVDCVLGLVGPAAGFRSGCPGPLLPYSRLERGAEAIHPRSDVGKALALSRSASDPEDFYEAARAEAEAFVREAWSEITKLAEKLMEVESLDEEGIEIVFDPRWPEFEEWLNEVRAENEAAPWTTGEGIDADVTF